MQAIDAPTQVSSAVLAEELIVLWHSLMRGTGRLVVEALNAHDLTLTQMKALNLLDDEHDGTERSVKDLGGCLALSLPAASRTIDGLLQRDLVSRQEDAQDRRIKRVAITEQGRALLRELEAARLTGAEAWADALSQTQRDTLHAALLGLRTPTPEDPTHA